MTGLSGLAVIQEKDLLMMIHLLPMCCSDGSDDSDESDLSSFCVYLTRLCKSISPEPEHFRSPDTGKTWL